MLVFNKCSFNYNLFLFVSKIQKKNTSEAKMYLNIEYLMIYCLKLNFDACWCIFNSKSLLNHLDAEKKSKQTREFGSQPEFWQDGSGKYSVS